MSNSSSVNPLPAEALPHGAAQGQVGPEQFTFLADMIPQLVWITDPTGFHTYFNQRWIDYTGYTLADSVGPDMWNNLLHPDDQARARQVWGHSLATGDDYEIEYRFKGRDGQYRWFLGQARPRRDEDGHIIAWFGTCTDIQDQKQAQQAQREREEEFTTLADNMAQLAWMTRPDGYIYWYNRRWYDYTGTTLEEMKGWGWDKVHHPDYINSVVEFVSKAWPAGQPWEMTFPLRGKDGQYRWFLTRAEPIRNEKGELVRWLGTNTDVTAMRELQQQLELAYSDLEAKVTFRNLDLEREVKQLREAAAAGK
ncbi:PAS domain-containing protein [Hymenobacter convexus]|uniref:PAS domain-containing protein n=1 Tax=Hymenobacter sp. CA1UV-4 TaxID=3063782 RepID=UPI0027130C81|nr:PAS domain-containing protein [Hymenobacter sp. CA1UV-4]MDO7852360.1 PAS domain-containing protein [Hymenobacter sp. CA1UV-4]